MVSICTTSLTFNNSTFCPHTVLMCFVWVWEQTATIYTGNFNLVDFRRFSQNREQLLLGSPCASLCPHETTRLPLNGIFMKFDIWIFRVKSFEADKNFITIWREWQVYFVKTYTYLYNNMSLSYSENNNFFSDSNFTVNEDAFWA